MIATPIGWPQEGDQFVTKSIFSWQRITLLFTVLTLSLGPFRSVIGQASERSALSLRAALAAPDAIKIPFESYKLPNGLTIILSIDRATPTVADTALACLVASDPRRSERDDARQGGRD